MKRTEPTKSLLQGVAYINSANTNIRLRFAAVKALNEQKKDNILPMKKVQPK